MAGSYNMSIVKKIVFGFLVTCGITALACR